MTRLIKMIFKKDVVTVHNACKNILIVMGILLVCMTLRNSENDLLYKVAVIDNDNTNYSKKLVNDLKAYKEIEIFTERDLDDALVKLSRGKYDVLYEIKEGYENKIGNCEYLNLIKSNKEVGAIHVKWVDDKLSLIVLREWMFSDIKKRIINIGHTYSIEDLREKYKDPSYKDILEINVHDVVSEDSLQRDNTKKVFFILWASVIILTVIGLEKKIIDSRRKGILKRFEFVGVSEFKYYVSYVLCSIIDIVVPFVISIIVVGYTEGNICFISKIGFTVVYIIVTWVIVALISKAIKNKTGFNILAQLLLLISIISSTGVLNEIFSLLYKIGKFIPMTIYVQNMI